MVDGLITVIEGNYHDAVGRRNIAVNGRFIRGYGLPDYASMSDSPPPLAGGQTWRDWLDAPAQ